MLNKVMAVWILAALTLVPTAMATAEPAAEQAAGAQAQPEKAASSRWLDPRALAFLAGVIGAGVVVIGGARGISRIGGHAVEAMARQPEAAGNISAVTIVTAAMIEGATLFGVVVCLLAVWYGRTL